MNYLHSSHLSFGLPIFKKCTLVLIGTLPLHLSTNVDTVNCTVIFILIHGLTQHICSIYMNGQDKHVQVHTHAHTHTHTHTQRNHLLLFQPQMHKITWHKTQEELQLAVLMETLCNGMQTGIMRVLHECSDRKEVSVRSTVMYWDNVMIFSWQMDRAKQVHTRHICANSILKLRDVMYSCDLYIQVMLSSRNTLGSNCLFYVM